MGSSKNHIFIVAGEASGDQHAAHLVEALKKKDPSLIFSGLGGSQMKSKGVKIFFDLPSMAVVGFWEVVKHYTTFKKIFNDLLARIDKEKPQAIILVDYPGFNLRLAKALHKRDIKVIYYISPQIWAWKKNRIHAIKKYVDRMLVVFEFEKEYYARHQMDVDFVGHILVDEVKTTIPREKFLKDIGLHDYRPTIGLMPGSRAKEVERHLPVMLETARLLKEEFPMLQFILIKSPTLPQHFYDSCLSEEKLPLRVVEGYNYAAIKASDVCLVASGTATLETAILEKPMVIMYKTSALTYLLAKMFVHIPDIGLVNIVAQKRIVPECVQKEAHPKRLAEELRSIFTDETKISAVKSDLRKVRQSLGGSGAAEAAADSVLNTLHKTS